MVSGYKIGNLDITPGLVLSPMSGVTTSAFRRLIKELNPASLGMVISEFISVEGMTRQSRRSLEMMRFHASERPFGIQIFGYDIQRMRDAAGLVGQNGGRLFGANCGGAPPPGGPGQGPGLPAKTASERPPPQSVRVSSLPGHFAPNQCPCVNLPVDINLITGLKGMRLEILLFGPKLLAPGQSHQEPGDRTHKNRL